MGFSLNCGKMRVTVLLLFIHFAPLMMVLSFDLIQIGGRSAKFDRFDGMCREEKNVIMTVETNRVRIVGNKVMMNITINVKEDMINEPILTLNIQRCKSKENPDTCEEFHNFSTRQYCKIIESKSELWNPFFSTVQPKWKCPIKKGIYHSSNSTFDVTAFLLFPVDGWFWKVRADQYDSVTNKRTFCLNLEARVTLNRRH